MSSDWSEDPASCASQDPRRARFAVRRVLGQGGEGRVLEVHDAALGHVVAMKEGAERLAREFTHLAALGHRNLPRVFDYFAESPLGSGRSAYTLELVSGPSLREAVQAAGPGADDLVWHAAVQLLSALAELHGAGLVHLDVKPDNVLVAWPARVKLVDFGIARPTGTTLTTLLGSRSYIAPELEVGATVTPRADLFSLGVTLAEAMLGSLREARELVSLPLHARLARLTGPSAGDARSALAELVAQLLAERPEARPSSAMAAAACLGHARQSRVELVPQRMATASGGFVGREVELSRLASILEGQGGSEGQGGPEGEVGSEGEGGSEGPRRPRTLVVSGPAGSGRGSLIVRAAVGAATRGVWVERWPQGDGTVLAFAALLDRLVDGGAAALGPAPAPTETHPEAFGQALAAYADGVVARLSERPRRHSALLILERSGAAPVLAVLDALTRSRGGLPFAVAARATEPGDGPAIALGPLDGAALGAFVSRRFGPIAGAERLVDHLRATTGGHPGTLVAMAELLVARGVIALGEEGWRLDRGLEAFVPPEVSALMEARIATWPEAARDLLEVWRALDVPLDLAALDALTRAEPGALDLLVATGMIRADGGRFALVPSVRRATPLPSALKERISRYSDFEHLDFRLKSRVLGGEAGLAELLTPIREALAEFRLDDAEQWSALGLELLDGRPGEGGLALLSLRVDIADRRGPREAQRDALRRLGEALPEGDPRALEVRSRLFWALTRMGDPSFEAEGRGVRARALAAGRTLLAAEIGVHLAIAKTQCGAWDEAEGLLLEARAALPEARGALALSARIANNLGNVQSYRGAFEAAAEAYREALAHKLEEGDPVGERIARGNLALMELELGRPGLALAGLHRSLALARQTGHRRGEAWCLLTLAEVGVEAGALRYAMRRARRAAEVAAELGDRLVEGDAWTTLAEARWLAGEPHAEAARRGLALAELAGSAWTRARARLLVAMADGGADGETTLEALEALVAEDTADPTTRRMAARILAERALVRGDTAAALSGLRQALSWSGGGRPGLRHAAFEATVLRAFEVARDAELGSRRAKLEAALARFVEGLPEAPRAEDDDPEAVYDGPSRRGASKALAAHSSRAVDDRGVPALNGAGGWGVSGVDTVVRSEAGALLTRTLGAFVRAVEAERAVVIVFTEAGAELLASCDADGEAVPDALKRLPEVVLEAARRDVCWRASGEGGALAVWPWRQPVGAGESSVALCAQNRFREHAFADLELGTRSAEPVKLVARLALVERALAMAEDAVKRAQAQVIRVERESTAEINSLRRELESTREQLGPAHAYRDILFTSDAMKRMLRQVDRVVGTDLSVHIHGESGTGKELIARAIHDLGARRGGPFVPQNCTAIPQTLFESELFGHERGSFTGAVRASEGLFRRAHRGTLFLDEIGDLPLELQAKLLRVLETGEVRPVGATKSVEVDVRIVSATHRDLGDLIKRGLFREDLYYRLNVIRIEVPPLRDRPDDIPLLVKHFLTQRGEAREIDPRAMRALVRYGWPGNVRQLENEVARASLLAGGDRIVLEDLSPDLAASKPDTHVATDAKRAGALSDFGLDRGPLKDRVDRLEAHALTTALAEAAQNKSEVARVLGLSRAGLNLKLKRLGLWEGDS